MTQSGKPRGIDASARARALDVARKTRPAKAAPSAPRPVAKAAGFETVKEYQTIRAIDQVSRALGLQNPYFRLHQGRAGATTRINGREVLNFASYDYLGLNGDLRVSDAAKSAIDLYGVSASASRMVAGERPVHQQLEQDLARHYNSDAALVFVSGHATNVSLIGSLMQDGDLILHDAYIHNSVTTGVALSSAARRSFAHNDLAALERMLERNRSSYKNVLVVAEGLYSMDGDLPNLPALVALKRRYGFWLMVDEAHALGSVGSKGLGSFEHFGVNPAEIDIWMGTLGKTLAATGGYVAGSQSLIDCLKALAPGFVYSVALPPTLAAAAQKSLEILHLEPARAQALHANAGLFCEVAAEFNLDTGLGQGFGVMPIMIGDSAKATKLSERLLERGINVAPVAFPGVPMQMARLRFFLSSDHTATQIKQALLATSEELSRLENEGFDDKLAAFLAQMKPDRK